MAARREAVQSLVSYGLSRRRAGVLLQLQRSTFDDQARPDRNALLADQGYELAQRHPRYGYRRVWALLRRRGQRVNKKHVHRLWKRAQWQIRKVPRQRRPARIAQVAVQALHPGHVWSDDVLHAHGLKGMSLKV